MLPATVDPDIVRLAPLPTPMPPPSPAAVLLSTELSASVSDPPTRMPPPLFGSDACVGSIPFPFRIVTPETCDVPCVESTRVAPPPSRIVARAPAPLSVLSSIVSGPSDGLSV